MNKICHLVLILFATCAVQAQVTPAVQDTIKKGFSIGKITIKDPKSILSGYTYDPATDHMFTPIRLMVLQLITQLF